MKPISSARVRELQRASAAYGALAGHAEKSGCVDGAIGAALTGAMYLGDDVDALPDPLHVAAFLLRYLAKDHCFEDGNKRAAWLSALDVLLSEGLTIAAGQDEAASFVEDIASGAIVDAVDIAEWLADHLVDAGVNEVARIHIVSKNPA